MLSRELRRTIAGFATLFAACSGIVPASAQSYSISETINTPGSYGMFSSMLDTSGAVVGAYSDGQYDRPFVYSGGTLTTLTPVANARGKAYGINDVGVVVGFYKTSLNLANAFIYSGGHYTLIPPISGNVSLLAWINDDGISTGYSDVNNAAATHAIVVGNNVVHDIGVLSGGTNSYGQYISSSGYVTGYGDVSGGNTHPFLYTGSGSLIDLGVPTGYTQAYGDAVNASGTVAVSPAPNTSGVSDGFLYSAGHYTDMGLLAGYPLDTIPYAINDSGVVVGEADDNSGDSHAFIYQNGVLTDLNTLIPTNSGWELQSANGITNSGLICGSGLYTSGGVTVPAGFVLTPAATTGHRFDFNQDGDADLLFQNSNGQTLVWYMNGQAVKSFGSTFTTVAPPWHIQAVADINADGHPDLLWWNSSTGECLFWEMTGALGTTVLQYESSFASISDTSWHPVSMVDFDGDGHPDILWENFSTGQLLVWYMNGNTIKKYGSAFTTLPANWIVAGTADFNLDGHPDLLLENTKTGQVLVWYLTGATGTTILSYGKTFATLSDTNWSVVSTGDMNGDGHPDLTWHNKSTGATDVWLMGGSLGTAIGSYGGNIGSVPTTWSVVGVH